MTGTRTPSPSPGAPATDLRLLVEGAADAILALDRGGRLTYANRAARALTGVRASELLGRDFADLVVPDDRDRVRRLVATALDRDRPMTYGLELRHRDGRTVPVEVSSTRLGSGGSIEGIQLIARDVSEREAQMRSLEHQAMHDPLTGLPNRTLLSDRLHQSVLAGRRTGTPFGLLLVDLDDFKAVNDAFGHTRGDRVLREVAVRLQGALRASDTVARLGGDEFAVLVPDCGASSSRMVARKLLRALERPVSLPGRRMRVGASIGIALYPEHGDEADDLLERADAAMYRAKRERAGFCLQTMGDADFGRPVRRSTADPRPPRSGRASAFLAGAAAALLIVAGAAAPQADRQPPVADPADGAPASTGDDEDFTDFLSGASDDGFDRIRRTGEPVLMVTPAVARLPVPRDDDDDDEDMEVAAAPGPRHAPPPPSSPPQGGTPPPGNDGGGDDSGSKVRPRKPRTPGSSRSPGRSSDAPGHAGHDDGPPGSNAPGRAPGGSKGKGQESGGSTSTGESKGKGGSEGKSDSKSNGKSNGKGPGR